MRLSASARAVSIRIGTAEVSRSDLASWKPVSSSTDAPPAIRPAVGTPLEIVEPEGLNRLWRNIRSYFRVWPFSY